MDVKTFRAKTMRDALDLVRRELGPSASVLHTREVNNGLLRRMVFGKEFEVAASSTVNVPSRLPASGAPSPFEGPDLGSGRFGQGDYLSERAWSAAQDDEIQPAHLEADYRTRYRDDFRQQVAGQLDELHAMVEKLCQRTAHGPGHDLPEALFTVFTQLIDAEVDEASARRWIDDLRTRGDARVQCDARQAKRQIAEMLENEIKVAGPISIDPNQCRVVALVGPTGVGKTTTIAKLAANFRLREKRRVGLITVDTYRVAAVEQLRTYAEIIDLPMEVVSTPREMREAVARMNHLDLVLMDTAGRSPRDDVRIQELKAMLAEAEADEVHLVLSTAAGAKNLIATAERFSGVGTSAILLTKLDEASSMGHLVSLIRSCRLPLSYLTDGQNVPDDIQVAQRRPLANMILGIESEVDV